MQYKGIFDVSTKFLLQLSYISICYMVTLATLLFSFAAFSINSVTETGC